MQTSWQCIICGYIHLGSEAPHICPLCGAGKEDFSLYTLHAAAPETAPRLWRCINCEYIHDGDSPPELCPVCGAAKDAFDHTSSPDTPAAPAVKQNVLIIGGGIAALSAAEELRSLSSETDITLVAEEALLPYYRLNLTRYLAQAVSLRSLEIRPYSWYEKNNIKLFFGTKVQHINRVQKTVHCDDDSSLPYDKLIIALGAHPFIPPIPGSSLASVMTVRTVADAAAILKKLPTLDRCVCIGGGILGLETAGAIAKSGIQVELLEGSDWLMPRQLNKTAGELLAGYMQSIGVTVRTNTRVQEIIGSADCEGVLLESGEILPTKLVLITAGVRPNTHLARKTGLEVNNGLVVNNYMQTSDPDIYAAGDVTEHYGQLYGLWNIAQYQGKVAARNISGSATQFGGVPRSNALKVLNIDVFSIGITAATDASYRQLEHHQGSSYYMFLVRDGRIAGSIIMGDKTAALKVKQAVEKATTFVPEVLTSATSLLQQL